MKPQLLAAAERGRAVPRVHAGPARGARGRRRRARARRRAPHPVRGAAQLGPAVQQPLRGRRERGGRPAQVQGVQYQLTGGGPTILVPESQVYDLRSPSRGKNLPAGDSGGWSLLDQQGMTSTDFQQNVAYQRALEGELGKTLKAMGRPDGDRPPRDPDEGRVPTDSDKPTASVLLALRRASALTETQVRSVMHLVAGSVPGLDASDVTVSDAQRRPALDPRGRRGGRRRRRQRDRRADRAVRGPDGPVGAADARQACSARARRRPGQRRS